jgi:hypothetical protein
MDWAWTSRRPLPLARSAFTTSLGHGGLRGRLVLLLLTLTADVGGETLRRRVESASRTVADEPPGAIITHGEENIAESIAESVNSTVLTALAVETVDGRDEDAGRAFARAPCKSVSVANGEGYLSAACGRRASMRRHGEVCVPLAGRGDAIHRSLDVSRRKRERAAGASRREQDGQQSQGGCARQHAGRATPGDEHLPTMLQRLVWRQRDGMVIRMRVDLDRKASGSETRERELPTWRYP